MRILLVLTIALIAVFTVFADDLTVSKVGISGDIGAQATVFLSEASHADSKTFDAMWQRLNLKAGYKTENLATVVHLRYYSDLSNVGAIKKSQIIQSWAKYSFDMGSVTVGRYVKKFMNGVYFGNYLYRGDGGSFCYPGTLYDGAQVTINTGMATSILSFGASDVDMNSGKISFVEVLKPMDKLQLTVGYSGNVYSDADLVSNVAVNAAYTYMDKQKVYLEVGLKDVTGNAMDTPITFGLSVPNGNFLKALNVEFEYAPKRADLDNNAILLALVANKSLTKNISWVTALHSDAAGTEMGDLGITTRLYATFK